MSFSKIRRFAAAAAVLSLGTPLAYCRWNFPSSTAEEEEEEEEECPHTASSALPIVVVGSGVFGVLSAYALATSPSRPKIVLVDSGAPSSSPSDSPTTIPRRSASYGNACTLGRSSPVQNLSSPAFLRSLLFPSSRRPATKKGEAPRNKFLNLDLVLFDAFFYRWATVWLKLVVYGYASHAVPPSSCADALRAPRAEQDAIARHPIVGSYVVHGAGRTIVDTETNSLKHYPLDAYGSCFHASSAVLRELAKLPNVDVRFGERATAIVVTDDDATKGRAVRGVTVTQEASSTTTTIEASAVVVCAGADSARLLLTAGFYVPIQPLRGYSATVPVVEGSALPPVPVVAKPHQLYATPVRERGAVRFTCYGEMIPVSGCFDRAPRRDLIEGLEKMVREVYLEPSKKEMGSGSSSSSSSSSCRSRSGSVGEEKEKAGGGAKGRREVYRMRRLDDVTGTPPPTRLRWDRRELWWGCRPLTPDGAPIVGCLGGVRGLYVNSGGSFNGWRASALCAEILSDVVFGRRGSRDGKESGSDVAHFRRAYAPNRF